MSFPQERLNEALSLARAMRARAERDDWEGVEEMWASQDAALHDGLESGIPFPDPSVAEKTVREVLRLNREIIEIGMRSKREIQKEHSEIKKGYKASKAYLSCAK